MSWMFRTFRYWRVNYKSFALFILILILTVKIFWRMESDVDDGPSIRDIAPVLFKPDSQPGNLPTQRSPPNPPEGDDWYERAAARQQEARQRLEEYCKGDFSVSMSEPTISPFFANSKHRVLFCICPKVSSRAIRFHFGVGQVSGMSYTLERFRAGFTNFMFVREPFQRLLSAYREKIGGKDRLKEKWLFYERKIIRKYRSDTPLEAVETEDVVVTFKEFVGYIISDGLQDGFDWHWKPFEEICRPCHIRYDFIGRYEHLEEDVKLLEKLANVHIENPFPPVRESKSNVELLEYYSTIPPEWILRLGEIYEIDFKMFGYPFPGPLESLVKDLMAQQVD